MANYATSVLTTAQAKLATKYNEAELRRKQRPAIGLAVKNSAISMPDHQTLKVAESRPVDVMYKLPKAAGATTAKVARHTGTKGDSAKITLAFNTIVEKFVISRKQAQGNVIGWQEMFQHEMEQAILNVLDRAETAAVAYLVANRCQLAAPTTSGAGTWSGVNFALEVAAANKARYIQYAKSFMEGRKFRGDLDCICDLALMREIDFQLQQGSANSTNYGFQAPGFNHVSTIDTILAAYTAGQGLVMPSGSFAGLVWNDPANRSGIQEDSYNGMLTTMLDPFGSGIVFDVSMYTDRSDQSAVGGHVQDFKDEWEISLNIGWALPPLSTASDSVVHLIAQG